MVAGRVRHVRDPRRSCTRATCTRSRCCRRCRPRWSAGWRRSCLFNEEASLYAFIGLFMLMGIVKKNGIMIVDFAIQRVARRARRAEQGDPRRQHGPLPPDHHDDAGGRHGRGADRAGLGRRRREPPAAGPGHRRRADRVSQFITLYVTPVIYLYLELFQEKVLDRIRISAPTRPRTSWPPMAGRPRPALPPALCSGCGHRGTATGTRRDGGGETSNPRAPCPARARASNSGPRTSAVPARCTPRGSPTNASGTRSPNLRRNHPRKTRPRPRPRLRSSSSAVRAGSTGTGGALLPARLAEQPWFEHYAEPVPHGRAERPVLLLADRRDRQDLGAAGGRRRVRLHREGLAS